MVSEVLQGSPLLDSLCKSIYNYLKNIFDAIKVARPFTLHIICMYIASLIVFFSKIRVFVMSIKLIKGHNSIDIWLASYILNTLLSLYYQLLLNNYTLL